ncbi:MAG: bifunctional folylpolyglutamate synthase/dihydrofolate synthase, partial [Bacteroidota bacterium]|nr:bifunctional folylpolyglutamate synthase/dihydrofolate synthase [Bacteroidota bacterium]
KGFTISEQDLLDGVAHVHSLTGFKGRWQILQEKPLIICDTGHNVDGIQQVISQLETTTNNLVHFVYGAVKDKDVSEILRLLPKHYRYYFCQAQIPRALPVDELMKLAGEAGLNGDSYNNVREAIQAAKNNVQENEVIFIGGSTFVVAEIEEL